MASRAFRISKGSGFVDKGSDRIKAWGGSYFFGWWAFWLGGSRFLVWVSKLSVSSEGGVGLDLIIGVRRNRTKL